MRHSKKKKKSPITYGTDRDERLFARRGSGRLPERLGYVILGERRVAKRWLLIESPPPSAATVSDGWAISARWTSRPKDKEFLGFLWKFSASRKKPRRFCQWKKRSRGIGVAGELVDFSPSDSHAWFDPRAKAEIDERRKIPRDTISCRCFSIPM